jgi:hypothetical protein
VQHGDAVGSSTADASHRTARLVYARARHGYEGQRATDNRQRATDNMHRGRTARLAADRVRTRRRHANLAGGADGADRADRIEHEAQQRLFADADLPQ